MNVWGKTYRALNKKRELSWECHIQHTVCSAWTSTQSNCGKWFWWAEHVYLHVASFPLEIDITLIEVFKSSTYFLNSKSKALSKNNYLNYVSSLSPTLIFKPAYGSSTDKSWVYCSLWLRPSNFYFLQLVVKCFYFFSVAENVSILLTSVTAKNSSSQLSSVTTYASSNALSFYTSSVVLKPLYT